MKSNVWLRLVWSDYQLQWDEADYGGIGVLRLPPDKVWKPDIVLFNKYDHCTPGAPLPILKHTS